MGYFKKNKRRENANNQKFNFQEDFKNLWDQLDNNVDIVKHKSNNVRSI